MTTARKTTQTAARVRDTSGQFAAKPLRWWQRLAWWAARTLIAKVGQ